MNNLFNFMEINKIIKHKIKTWRLIFAILMVYALGLLLKSFNLNPYIILFGFRFHISFVLPFILVYNSYFLSYLKKSFTKPEWKKSSFPLLLILLPIIIETVSLYFLQKIDLGDPEYFYEFGISSIADYPIYFIWNFPQMILLFIFLASVAANSKFSFISVAVVFFSLFVFEVMPINKSIIQYNEIWNLFSYSIIFSILINYYRNIYLFGVSLFTLSWIAVLAFGSSSKTIINLLFASRYDNWEGFFEVAKDYLPYIYPFYFGISLIIFSSSYLLFTRQNNISER